MVTKPFKQFESDLLEDAGNSSSNAHTASGTSELKEIYTDKEGSPSGFLVDTSGGESSELLLTPADGDNVIKATELEAKGKIPGKGRHNSESRLLLKTEGSSKEKSDSDKVSKSKKKAGKKMTPLQRSGDDLDTLLAEMSLADSRCSQEKCRKKVNVIGQKCQFCGKRFCMEHSIPELHGCAEEARKHARRSLQKAGIDHTELP